MSDHTFHNEKDVISELHLKADEGDGLGGLHIKAQCQLPC